MGETSKTRGGSFRRGQAGYEAARRAALRNALLPNRFPEMIVQANDVYDVIRAVKLARRENWRVAVRSGGHSWAGNHIRDGGMLLDVSRLDDARIDKHALRATAGPGCTGAGLAMRLLRQGLFFPAGHCRGVCLGGYLLQGGYGWHSRVLGPACMSVEGIDVVTADGELIHASADENADLYWSARGAGPGFFGVVTRFHLRLYRRPKLIGAAVQTFSIDKLEEVFRWAHGIRREVPAAVELMLLLSRDTPGVRGPGILAIAPVFADSWRAAWDAASFLTHGPLRRRASLALPFVPTGLNLLYTGVMQHYPADHRYAVDNMWTGASFDDLLPGLRRIAETLPAAPSHALWMNWVPPPSRPDMAYSMEDEIYLALYSVWKDAKDDAAFAQWPVERMREMQHLCSGCQLADENLGQRPVRFVSDEHLARLDRIRAERDPQSRFFPWMGRPNV